VRSYVVDASVATRFLLEEDLSGEAKAVLRGYLGDEFDLVAPPIIVYEVGNSLRTASTRNVVDHTRAVDYFKDFLGMKLGRLVFDVVDLDAALGFSISRGLSYYDGMYVWASKKESLPLLTADDRQYAVARGETEVIHLKDFVQGRV
jgi:predicted nucleic acid-binding protein